MGLLCGGKYTYKIFAAPVEQIETFPTKKHANQV